MVPSPIDSHADSWEHRLTALVQRLDVPGAVLGVSHHGQRFITAAGVAGLRAPYPITADTAFQLGSISKVYTATLLLKLGGSEILQRPVAELVPEAAWMAPSIRVIHLLTHSSGLGGDWFADTGRGDDALACYVTELQGQPFDHPLPPGTRYSYCNSGFAVLGRLIEVLCGQSYDAALRTHLLEPLGASRTTTLAEDAILGPVALGHNRGELGPLTADERWNFARAGTPLGGVCATAGDVLTFAELHLHDGRAADGTEILSAAYTELMRSRHLENPPRARPSARGLGWGIYDCRGGELTGHDGETLGQIASLRLLPEHELAVVVLTNAIPDGNEITTALVEAVTEPLGLAPPLITTADHDTAGFDPAPYLGRYRNLTGTFDVTAADSGLTVTNRHTTEGLEQETTQTRLIPLGDGAFVDAEATRPTRALRFADPDAGGRCRSYFTGRIAWRTIHADE